MILSEAYSESSFVDFLLGFLPDFELDRREVLGKTEFSEVKYLGASKALETHVLAIRPGVTLESRIKLSNATFKILKRYSIYRALVVYVNDDDSIWRLSLLTATPQFSKDGVVLQLSNPRRHSYILGTETGIATARKYLMSMGRVVTIEDLDHRFSVEAVNRDFYREISRHFYSLVGVRDEDGNRKTQGVLQIPGGTSGIDSQAYAVRLIGRLIFMWFLKQKNSSNGKSLLPADTFEDRIRDGEDVLHKVLEPLWFQVLNQPVNERLEEFRGKEYSDVPYLNGGLFHPHEGAGGDYFSSSAGEAVASIPDEWFQAFLVTMQTYNFTIDENLENDVDLSIDPEMLGRVFENLLAEIDPDTGQVARKSTGSYYTPRAIVGYMVDESLLHHLSSVTHIAEPRLRAVISLDRHDDEEFPLSDLEKLKIVDAVGRIRFLDPACGSGAFPMALLQKLLWILTQVDPRGEIFLDAQDFSGTEHWLTTARLDYLRKRKLIRDVIFGADIQPIAVEIAKLRCFLTLIVDQEIDDSSSNRGVIPLPNLEFKFVCADSLTPLDRHGQFSFGGNSDLEDELREIRNRYFVASGEIAKKRFRERYEALIQRTEESLWTGVHDSLVLSFRPFTVNHQALYFDPSSMFGFEKFNLILGNPPYVTLRAAHYKPLVQKLRAIEFYSAALGGNLNLYRHFIERSMSLLQQGGVLSFIVPSTIVADRSSAGIRRLIRDKSELLFLIEFPEDARIFESITQATTIFLLKAEAAPSMSKGFGVSIKSSREELPPSFSVILNWREIAEISGDDLAIPLVSKGEEIPLLKKLINSGRPLRQFAKVYEGDAHQTKYAASISDLPKNRLFVTGSHVGHFNIDLSLEKTKRRWFDLQPGHSFALKERLVIQGIANMGQRIRIKGAKLEEGIVVGNSANCVELHSDDISYEYLLGLLSSEVANWFFRKFSTNNNVNAYEVESIPVPVPDHDMMSDVEECVRDLSRLATEGQVDSPKWQTQISLLNMYFFEIYGLDSADASLISET